MDRLRNLHLPSLELKRLHVDLVWSYKILFGIVETPTKDFSMLQLEKRPPVKIIQETSRFSHKGKLFH